jgi:hypothetical protein
MPEPAINDLNTDRKIAILTAAYTKHGNALGAIEGSQQTLLNLVLGIFSAALTLLIGLYKDSPDLIRGGSSCLCLSALDWVMIAAAALVMAYAVYMSHGRNAARISVRRAVANIDAAFGFFENGLYLKDAPLYPTSFAPYTETSFLRRAYWLIYPSGAAFILAVVVLSRS